jgi:endonuclease III
MRTRSDSGNGLGRGLIFAGLGRNISVDAFAFGFRFAFGIASRLGFTSGLGLGFGRRREHLDFEICVEIVVSRRRGRRSPRDVVAVPRTLFAAVLDRVLVVRRKAKSIVEIRQAVRPLAQVGSARAHGPHPSVGASRGALLAATGTGNATTNADVALARLFWTDDGRTQVGDGHVAQKVERQRIAEPACLVRAPLATAQAQTRDLSPEARWIVVANVFVELGLGQQRRRLVFRRLGRRRLVFRRFGRRGGHPCPGSFVIRRNDGARWPRALCLDYRRRRISARTLHAAPRSTTVVFFFL